MGTTLSEWFSALLPPEVPQELICNWLPSGPALHRVQRGGLGVSLSRSPSGGGAPPRGWPGHLLGQDAVPGGRATWLGGPQGPVFQGELQGPRVAAACRQPAGQEPT